MSVGFYAMIKWDIKYMINDKYDKHLDKIDLFVNHLLLKCIVDNFLYVLCDVYS